MFFLWNFTTPGIFGLLTARRRRNASSRCPRGVLHCVSFKECFTVQPWRSPSPCRPGGVHQLPTLEEFITWQSSRITSGFGFLGAVHHFFFRSSAARGFLRTVHCGTLLERSTLVLFGSSPACGFLRVLHLRAF